MGPCPRFLVVGMWQFWPFGLLNLFPVFPCDMVVGTFSMSFLGGKYFKAVVSVLVYEIPTLRLPGNRQRKGSKSIVIFSNSNSTVWSHILCFSFFACSCEKSWCFIICLDVVFNFCWLPNFLYADLPCLCVWCMGIWRKVGFLSSNPSI